MSDDSSNNPEGTEPEVGDDDLTTSTPNKSNVAETPNESIPGYKILKELSRGGQGVVYQALQKSARRKVAVKVMLQGPFAGSESKRRFEREIALVGSLRHPNIVPVFDSGVAQGKCYYAMEYIRGKLNIAWSIVTRRSCEYPIFALLPTWRIAP